MIKFIRIFLLVLIIIGLGLIFTKNIWVPKLVDRILKSEITYSNASVDFITVESPVPGAVVGKDFSITGMARGAWFFEASFPTQILSSDGKVLASTPAQAVGEPGAWMTENFVPFMADIHIADPYTGVATLVLRKDNPSGLPEHDASISFPITIKN